MSEKKTGNTDAVTSWVFNKCGHMVYISESIHAAVCYLYKRPEWKSSVAVGDERSK
jgi:hypothetical protein